MYYRRTCHSYFKKTGMNGPQWQNWLLSEGGYVDALTVVDCHFVSRLFQEMLNPFSLSDRFVNKATEKAITQRQKHLIAHGLTWSNIVENIC